MACPGWLPTRKRPRRPPGRPATLHHRHARAVGGDHLIAPRHGAGQSKTVPVAELLDRVLVLHGTHLVPDDSQQRHRQFGDEQGHAADGLERAVVGLGDEPDRVDVPNGASAQVLGRGLHVDDDEAVSGAEVLQQRRHHSVRRTQAPFVGVRRCTHAEQAHPVGSGHGVLIEDLVDRLGQAGSADAT